MNRGNSIFNRLFANSVHSIRRLASNESEAKAIYRFLQNDHVSEDDIIRNMKSEEKLKQAYCCGYRVEIHNGYSRQRIRD